MIKKFLFALIIFVLNVSTCAANEEFDAAEIRFSCALCSFGAYSDENGAFVRSMLTADKWQIETLSQKTKSVTTKAYLISKGDNMILTIAGTESIKDAEVDFRVGRVHLDGTPIVRKEKDSGDEIFVHKGFCNYTDAMLDNGLAERLTTSLKNNPNATLYITGHSLGGAVATLTAIRLIDSGVDKNRVKVITFGAPAVGSKALAAAYSDKINLTRVEMKGDFIKKSLSELGYVQFGKVYTYTPSFTSKQFEHKVSVYLDCAIREYYAAGGDLLYENQGGINASIYVAPILVVKDSLHKTDADIVLRTLNDILGNHFSRLTFAPEKSVELAEEDIIAKDFAAFASDARTHGCKYVLIRVLSSKKIRDAMSGENRVTLEEYILDASGSLLFMQTSGSSTKDLTIIEIALISQEKLIESTTEFFKGK